MAEHVPQLFLRVATLQGVVYEKYIKYVQVKKKDGVMIINRNYSPVMERLADGNIVVHEHSKQVIIETTNSWLTVSDNKCHIYSNEAKIVSE